jgi:hypothetical protein
MGSGFRTIIQMVKEDGVQASSEGAHLDSEVKEEEKEKGLTKVFTLPPGQYSHTSQSCEWTGNASII